MAGLFAQLGAAFDEALNAAGNPPPQQQPRAGSAASSRRPSGGQRPPPPPPSAGDAAAAAAAEALSELQESPLLLAVAGAVSLFIVQRLLSSLLTSGLWCCLLAWLFVTCPTRTPDGRGAAWQLLASARAREVAAATDDALSRGALLSALRTAVTGGASQLAGRRVTIDCVFFAVAFYDTTHEVDARTGICALGALGEWRVLRSPALRSFALARARAAEAQAHPHSG